jgi:maleylpyruvate isomerase
MAAIFTTESAADKSSDDYFSRPPTIMYMTVPVPEVISAHRRFVADVSGLTAVELAVPTALPGWTRGHVIAHVADGGRAFADLTEAALRGEIVSLFPGGVDERNARIEEFATAPDLMDRLGDGIARLEAAWARAEPGDWRRPVRFRNGDLAGTVFARWRETWIHLVDCAVGVTPADWPESLAAHVIDFLWSRVPSGVALVATDTGEHWGSGDPVSGTVRDLAAWVAGRTPMGAVAGPPVGLNPWPPHPVPDR